MTKILKRFAEPAEPNTDTQIIILREKGNLVDFYDEIDDLRSDAMRAGRKDDTDFLFNYVLEGPYEPMNQLGREWRKLLKSSDCSRIDAVKLVHRYEEEYNTKNLYKEIRDIFDKYRPKRQPHSNGWM